MLISKRAFPQRFPAGTGTVYLARGDVLADALAAGSLMDGPVILVPRCGTPPVSVIAEVTRLDPKRVVALGTDFSVCDNLLATVAQGRATDRFGGPNRYATALLIAAERAKQGPVTEIYLASGADTAPDAVAGGSLTRGPILTLPATEHPSVSAAAAWVAAQPNVTKVIALGGTDKIPSAHLTRVAAGKITDRIAGSNRYITAAGIATYQFPSPVQAVYLARGDIFADAVSAGAFTDGPILLTASCSLPQAVRDAIQALRPGAVIALGSFDAVCDQTLHDAMNAVLQPGVQLSAETKVLDEQDLTRLTSYDPATGTIVFADTSSPAPAAVGEIIVAGYTQTVPTGFLRRVTAVTHTPQGIRLTTTEATLPEALADTGGSLVGGEAQLLASYVEPAEGVTIVNSSPALAPSLQRATNLLSAQAVELDFEHTLKLKKEFKAQTEGANFTGTGTLTLDATVMIGGTLTAEARTSWLTLEELRLEAGPKASASVNAHITGELKGSASPALGKVTRFWNIQLGLLPVTVVEVTDMTIDAEISTTGKIGFTTGVTGTTRVGIHYRDDSLEGILDAQGTATPPSINAEATASIDLSVGPQTDIRVYGVAGLKSTAGPWASLTTAVTGNEAIRCTLEAGLKAELAAVAGIDILGVKAQLEQGRTTTLTLVKEELCDLDADNPADVDPATGLPHAGGGSPTYFDISTGVRVMQKLGPDGRLHLCNNDARATAARSAVTRAGQVMTTSGEECFVAQDGSGAVYLKNPYEHNYVRRMTPSGEAWTSTAIQYVWPTADGSLLGLSTGFRGTLGLVNPNNGSHAAFPQEKQYNRGEGMRVRMGPDAVGIYGIYNFSESVLLFDRQTWQYATPTPSLQDGRVLALGPGATAITARSAPDCRSVVVAGHTRAGQVWHRTIEVPQPSTYCNIYATWVRSAGDYAWIGVPIFADSTNERITAWKILRFDYSGNSREVATLDALDTSSRGLGNFVGDTAGNLVYAKASASPCRYNERSDCISYEFFSIGSDFASKSLGSIVPQTGDQSIVDIQATPGFGQLWVTYRLFEQGRAIDYRLRSIPAPLRGDAVDVMHHLPASR